MVEVTPGHTGWDAWSQPEADAARTRHMARARRLQREREENDARLAAKAAAKLREVESQNAATPDEKAEQQRKKAIIAAAIERARVKKEEMAARSKA
jgi:electron transport complex protein RnfB